MIIAVSIFNTLHESICRGDLLLLLLLLVESLSLRGLKLLLKLLLLATIHISFIVDLRRSDLIVVLIMNDFNLLEGLLIIMSTCFN